MYCRNCGKEIDENAFICVHCGSLVNGGRVKTFRRNSNTIGIASIIAGILALSLSLSCFLKILVVLVCIQTSMRDLIMPLVLF